MTVMEMQQIFEPLKQYMEKDIVFKETVEDEMELHREHHGYVNPRDEAKIIINSVISVLGVRQDILSKLRPQ